MQVYALWSSPRSRSTAFFRSMAERGDVRALHEPLWELHAFGETVACRRTFCSQPSFLSWLGEGTADKPVFLKETTDHRFESVLADQRLLSEARHTFLIRQPSEIVASYYALWPEMRVEEVGLESMFELYEAVIASGGHAPVVIDSDDLVTKPSAAMAAFCSAIGLPFIPEALTWESGNRSDWAQSQRWHVQASESSGFEEVKTTYPENVGNSAKLSRFAAHHQPFYDRLHARRLRITDR